MRAGPDIAGRRLFIIDDEPANVLLLDKILRRAGFTAVAGETDPAAALARFGRDRPDLVLLDLHMPGVTGFDLLARVRASAAAGFLPVLVLTADTTPAARDQALAAGATDFLTKPFDPTEALLRVRNLLDTQTLHRILADHNRRLEAGLRTQAAALEDARLEVAERLARAAEYRDDQTGQHTQRVGRTARDLAAELGLPAADAELLRRAAPLHDVGKIGIPDAILLKPGRLDPAEAAVMRTHTTIGGDILGRGRTPLIRAAEAVARTHHENWDGSGYPAGLAGDAIPVAGRIVAVADVFNALTHTRPYKPAWPAADAVAEIARLAGTKFDPRVAAAFARLAGRGVLSSDTPPPPEGLSVAGLVRAVTDSPVVPPTVTPSPARRSTPG